MFGRSNGEDGQAMAVNEQASARSDILACTNNGTSELGGDFEAGSWTVSHADGVAQHPAPAAPGSFPGPDTPVERDAERTSARCVL